MLTQTHVNSEQPLRSKMQVPKHIYNNITSTTAWRPPHRGSVNMLDERLSHRVTKLIRGPLTPCHVNFPQV